jgi:hypothetical protein
MPKSTSSTREKPTASGTEENFSFGSGRTYADNAEYASAGLTFDVLAIAYEPGKGFDGNDRWALTVKAADREAEVMCLGSNPGRDKELQAARDHLEHGGTITHKRLRRSGNAYYLADGDR